MSGGIETTAAMDLTKEQDKFKLVTDLERLSKGLASLEAGGGSSGSSGSVSVGEFLTLPAISPPPAPSGGARVFAGTDNRVKILRPGTVPMWAVTPPGAVLDFAGATAPPGFLACDGGSYSTTLYPELFAAIGYLWGGAGANFNVPDSRGRGSLGAGAGAGLTARTLGTSLGQETVTYAATDLPGHTHPVFDPSHSHGVSGHYGPSANSTQAPAGVALAGQRWQQNVQADVTTTAATGVTVGTNTVTPGANTKPIMNPVLVFNKIIAY